MRPLTIHGRLDIICALHFQRRVDKYGTISFQGKQWPAPGARLRSKATLVIRPPTDSRHPHTEIYILDLKGRELAHHIVTQAQESTTH